MGENGQKQPKTILCHHKQCIFDPKMTKTAKTRIFPDTTLPFDNSKQLFPVSDQVLDSKAMLITIKEIILAHKLDYVLPDYFSQRFLLCEKSVRLACNLLLQNGCLLCGLE